MGGARDPEACAAPDPPGRIRWPGAPGAVGEVLELRRRDAAGPAGALRDVRRGRGRSCGTSPSQ